jgi:hypothetical protein
MTFFSYVSQGDRSFVVRQWALQDSNLRPTGYEPAALPLS